MTSKKTENHFLHQTSGKMAPAGMEIEKELLSDLNRLGEMAETLSPKPLKPVFIPEKKGISFNYFVPALAFGVALLVVFFIGQTGPPTGKTEINTLEVVYNEIEKDEKFMNEVNALIEDVAYSDFYPDSTIDEGRYDFSDEFIDVIVPI